MFYLFHRVLDTHVQVHCSRKTATVVEYTAIKHSSNQPFSLRLEITF